MTDKLWTRRAFLATTTTTALVVTSAGCNTAKVVPKKLSPNEKMNIAGIGVGGKGLHDIMACKRENIVALCDPDWDRAGEAFYKLEGTKHFKDYRVMLDTMGDEIDACTISTPDHTHAPAAYTAMNLGKHVYVQKPLTHTIAEARLLQKTAQKTGVMTQMGNQGHCGNGVRDLCEMLWDGAIGEIQEAHIWTSRPGWPQGIADPLPKQEIPKTMDWDLWIGTAPMRDYNPGYAPFAWRGWWDFGCGAIGDMACHIFDPAFWSLKLYEAEEFTCEAVMQHGMTKQCAPLRSTIKFEFPARGDLPAATVYWHDGKFDDKSQNFPKWPVALPEGEKWGDGANGSMYIGSKGVATAGEYGGDPRLMPAENMKNYKKPTETLARVPRQNPYLDWIRACKDGKPAASNFDYASPLTQVANMGNVALFAGKKFTYSMKKGKITSDAALNPLLTKPYRKGWELPC